MSAGQRSVAPSTDYARPVISSLGGKTAGAWPHPSSQLLPSTLQQPSLHPHPSDPLLPSDLSTNGGETVLLYGADFSTQPFLDAVTYGPTGVEYTAASCVVTVAHAVISCVTVPGTGRQHFWMVSVGGQVSTLSPVATSYAAPSILALSPASGPTPGGAAMSICGLNFGLAVASSRLVVKFNTAMAAPKPSPAQWVAWRNSKLNSAPAVPAVDAWVASLYSPPLVAETRGASNDTVSIVAPPGYGSSAQVIVLVDGIPSDWAMFAYNAPVITNLAPDRAFDYWGEGLFYGAVVSNLAPD